MNDAPIKPPVIYAEWSELLDKLKNKENDAYVLAAMQSGTIVWQSGVAERFARKLIDTVNARMNLAADKFQKDMARANGHEGAIVQALLSLRKEFAFLYQAMDLPAIPENDRTQYCALVREQADTAQTSLEESAKQDRSGKMASIIRNHKINNF
ncbi:MAG: hypothetical protein LBQ16_00185 [Gracilibacteraceae bacterium]|jgi:hypothetical protein|nr:hypothetical protein [Gracilibacteraceae bacterium]